MPLRHDPRNAYVTLWTRHPRSPRAQRYRAAHKAYGLCLWCNSPAARPRTLCLRHLEAVADRMRQRYRRLHPADPDRPRARWVAVSGEQARAADAAGDDAARAAVAPAVAEAEAADPAQ